MSKEIQIYTDGACSGNPGPGGTGYLILGEGINVCSGTGYRKTTNNRMEILAVIESITRLSEILDNKTKRDTDVKVTVFSDSQLVVKTMTEGWSRSSNKDLWKRLDETIDTFNGKVSFVKVKGHANDTLNNKVDEMAVAKSKNPTDVDEVYEDINKEPKKGNTLWDTIVESEEPEIKSVNFLNYNFIPKRKIEVELSNGNTVTISALYEGFQQTGCTMHEAYVTLAIAKKFNGWLHGKEIA